MPTITIRQIDVLVSRYHKGVRKVIEECDLQTPPIDPKALAEYQGLKQLQQEALAIGYDLDTEMVAQYEVIASLDAAS